MKKNGKSKIKKVVLAYSGGLDTSVIVPWLIENYGCEVVCYTADIGQGEELSGLPAKAKASGASKIYIEDLKEEFARDYLMPLLKSGAIYERKYLLGTSIARPLIAYHLVKTAHKEGADAIAHGCTGKGNDQVRFELTAMALDPRLKVIAPWREWNIRSREDALAYAQSHNIPVSSTLKSIYSRDKNLWHLSHEGGLLEDPWNEPEESMYQMSNSPLNAPDQPETITLDFEKGIPSRLNGNKMPIHELIVALNEIGGKHAIGRVDLVENRLVGMKSHGVYETPGGTILLAAHQELEGLCLDRDTLHFKEIIAHRYAELVYNGQWFTPLREALDEFINKTQETVTGTVKLKLYKGNIIVAGRTSPESLYREDFATFGQDDVYNQKDAQGFITLFGLPMKVQALRKIHKKQPAQYDQPDYTKFKRD
ncbi:argininosuccinate synthase [Bellilinea caldifistulae]|uniref:Argininosuccinate synthase n=1 Tax=Bellilinea caldifistulae TaxID=360411 RepID=A0A0P6X146_9CHLR|nr:argininosuccinate synthase [Bellilinea caldifistulae]KPL73028.1 argininosuccinate synthase [Bellilinea caldifistulae]GAP10987.1 argininosuccinate synthase [Bellilinea caldifistulae]